MVPIPHLAEPSHGECRIQTDNGPTCSFKLRILVLEMSTRARLPKILTRGLWSTAMYKSVQPRTKCRHRWSASATASGSVTALCCVGEPVSYESDPSAVLAAEEFALGAGAVALKHPIADAILVKDFYTSLNLVDDLPLGGFKRLLVIIRP